MLSQDLMNRLKARPLENRSTRLNGRFNSTAMKEAAIALGISIGKNQHDDVTWWNKTIDRLDAIDPLWRGYEVRSVNPFEMKEIA
jgi:hypothetical protein